MYRYEYEYEYDCTCASTVLVSSIGFQNHEYQILGGRFGGPEPPRERERGDPDSTASPNSVEAHHSLFYSYYSYC
jgi:hypothetical protein